MGEVVRPGLEVKRKGEFLPMSKPALLKALQTFRLFSHDDPISVNHEWGCIFGLKLLLQCRLMQFVDMIGQDFFQG